MFCSKSCMSKAKSFHDFECHTIDVNPDEENDIFEVAHRVVFEALGMFGKIEKLQKFVEEYSEKKSVFDFSLAEGDQNLKEKNLLRATLSLQRNQLPEKLQPLMRQHVKLIKSITKNPKHQTFLGEFMQKQMEISITNSFGMTCNGEIVGSGIFPLSSLFNHSCVPNVTRLTIDNKLVFVTTRPVESNQQLFVCYRSNFYDTIKEERQEEIFKSYRFECDCEACNKDFKTLKDLSLSDESFKVPQKQPRRDEFKLNCNYIDANIQNFPNFELCTLMARNQTILELIANVSQLIA